MFDFGNNQQSHRPLSKKLKRSRIIDDINQDENFQVEQDVVQDPINGMVSTETQNLIRLGCGDTIISPAEIGQACQCGRTLCKTCSSIRCSKCLLVYCPWCLHLWDGVPFCGRCKCKAQVKRGMLVFVKGIHSFLSKRF